MPQVPLSAKYLATAIAACFAALPPPAEAQTEIGGDAVSELIVPGEGSYSETVTQRSQFGLPSFFSLSTVPVGVWLKHGGSFTDNGPYTKLGSTTLFQIGGSVKYTGFNESIFKNDTDSLGGTISLHLLYSGLWQHIHDPNDDNADPSDDFPPPDNLSLTIAVIGSSKADSVFSAERINSWAGVNKRDGVPVVFTDKRVPDSIHIFVDGTNSDKYTGIKVENSAEILTKKRSEDGLSKDGASFIVQNGGVIEVGKSLSITMRNDDDRFIIDNNSKPNTGIIVYGNPGVELSLDSDNGKDFNFVNSAKPLEDISGVSTTALIRNSNVDIRNGSFVLWGGQYFYETTQKNEDSPEITKLVDEVTPETTFLQIINDDQSKAEFRARSVELHAITPGNKTTLLLGRGANVVADQIALFAPAENSTAILMLGDTSSTDENYSPNVKKVFLGYVDKVDPDKGERMIIFNNNHRGESAEKTTFEIQGIGIIRTQTGRTLLTKNSKDFSGQTIIDPNTTLILTADESDKADRSTWGVGSSKITIHRDGELIYRGVTDDFHNAIVGDGRVVLNNSFMSLDHDAGWNGLTTLNDSSTLSLGTLENPVRIKSVHVSKEATLWGFGSIEGSLNNEGHFRVGDNIFRLSNNLTTPRLVFTVDGDVTNSGEIHLGNGKTLDGSFRYSGNTLAVNRNYTGKDGLIVFNTVLNGDNDSPTDKLIVMGDTDGSSRVKVNNLRGHGEQTTNGIELIRVEGNSSGTFVKDGRIFAGAYEYNLERGTGANDKNWYLISRFRPETGAYIGNSAVVQTLFSSRLHDRIGDLWYADPFAVNNQLTGVWMKQRGNYNTWRESSGQTRNRTQMYATQIGADVASWTSNGENRFLVGWVAGYGHGRTKSRSIHTGYHAIGTVDGLNVGVTGTWYQDGLHHQGIYVDTWLTYGWFDNKVKGQGIETEKYHSRGFTGSLETGYTWKLGEHITEKGCDIGWFLQPQAQMIWSGVKTDTFHEHNGTTVKSRGRNNIQTRLGARLMMDTNLRSYANGIGGTQFFIEGNWVHNTKSHGVEMNGTVFDQEGARHLGEVKFGINGKPTDNLHVWTNVTVRAGTHHYRDLTGMIGLKYSF